MIFPDINYVEPVEELQIPDEETIIDRGKNILFDFEKGEFILINGNFVEVSEDAGVVYWIEKILRTDLNIPIVYQNTDFGCEIRNLTGQVLPEKIAKAIIRESLLTSLKQHERIEEVYAIDINIKDGDITIKFNVKLIPITITQQGVSVTDEELFTNLKTLEEIQEFLGIEILTSDAFTFKTKLGNFLI